MKPLSRARPESYPSRAEKVVAIKKAVREGTYEIDGTKVADVMLIHLLAHSIRLQRTSFNLH
jgi:anti-sigma28 factor (negative regulator of flagellin synthesis)